MLTSQLKNHFEPWKDPNSTSDPKRTLFVSNLPYEMDDLKLYHKMKEFGEVRDVRVVTDKKGKSRGYGFVQFKRRRDLEYAYKEAHCMKVGGRRLKVDFERGRNSEGWLPRRLGGGKGGRKDRVEEQKRREVIEAFKKGEFDGIIDVDKMKIEAKLEAKRRRRGQRPDSKASKGSRVNRSAKEESTDEESLKRKPNEVNSLK